MAPFKRQRQPKMTTQALLAFDLGESSSDSDFRIEDEEDDDGDGGDDDNSSSASDEDDNDDDDEEDKCDSDDSTLQLKQLLAEATEDVKEDEKKTTINKSEDLVVNGGDNLEDILRRMDAKPVTVSKIPLKAICCVCLGDRSDDSNEIVECDGCGVSVHEGCYGVSDNNSISSTNSTCSTEPWFCEACRAGVSEPTCELCPNKGGIYKETDVGKWVHLVCALYVPGVAFGEVDQLSCVTLFEMQYSKWGAKPCSLCEDSRFSRTGVCIGCDAGMCKTYFHVTCAQAAGFLTEAHHEDTDAADPFYAHCKVHSEKELIRKRKRNYHTFRANMEEKQKEKSLHNLDDPCPAQMRINRKLQKYQVKYANHKQARVEPWVPTQKMSRLITTSASAYNRLLAKANVMEVDVDLMERQDTQIQSLIDIRKKWHIAPAFSVEFVAYYIDRIARTKELKEQLTEMVTKNSSLTKDQSEFRSEYDSLLDKNKDLKDKHESLINSISQIHTHISSLCPNKNLPNPLNIGRPTSEEPLKTCTPTYRPISVPTAAALKMGVGFPLAHLGHHPNTKGDSNRLLSTQAKDSPLCNSSPIAGYPSAFIHHGQTHKSPKIHLLSTAPPMETHNCGICKQSTDQHLLAKCDTCKLFYHLGCLNPPLTRHPKKSKLYGWQCSECDKSDQSDVLPEMPKGPRKSRTRFNKDGIIVPVKSVTPNQEDTLQQHLNSTKTDNQGPGPAKRRSLDNQITANFLASPSSSTSFKKLLNKSLPNVIETPKPTDSSEQKCHVYSNNNNNNNDSSDSITPKLSKKSKLSLNYSKSMSSQQIAQPQPEIVNNEKSSFKTSSKSSTKAYIENTHPSPVLPSLPIDEPLVLVMTPKSSTPLPVVADADPLALPPSAATTTINPTIANNITPLEGAFSVTDVNSKQSRKQKRKDKHKNKHNLSSDTERSLSKEHKRKRKKKQHDMEAPSDTMAGIPKIKIKFKTLPLPGEVTPEAQFFYVSADMVRSADEASRPGSVETIEDFSTSGVPEDPIPTTPKPNVTPPRPISANALAAKTISNSPSIAPSVTPAKTFTSPRKSSPRKPVPSRLSAGYSSSTSTSSGRTKVPAQQSANQVLACCVCHTNGTTTNMVTCDECRKHYHFTCLDPPLKKSPKIRGYSWHCADCDPTDEEKH
ncbi:PHD finger protein 14 [Stomoxys calcitrans]|uniref:PHD finger protein 14 n=1 Tax=Stomoxys calcitrans TaxID=35570 RepID=UPI0027E2B2BB|nr:PHD finger protein 14 [Stomoxys calcitrans]